MWWPQSLFVTSNYLYIYIYVLVLYKNYLSKSDLTTKNEVPSFTRSDQILPTGKKNTFLKRNNSFPQLGQLHYTGNHYTWDLVGYKKTDPYIWWYSCKL